MTPHFEFDRRKFIQTAGSAAAATALVPGRARADINSTLRVAVLGVHGRGQEHIKEFQQQPGVEVAVLCDPDAKVLAQRAAQFEAAYGRKVETEADLRRVFERKDIDAVSVATPNHWHALATIWACQADKDVYVEKPGSHNLFEGRQMIAAAEKHQRIVQHGVQLRSSPAIQEAVGHLRKGTIGNVYMARGIVYRQRASIGQRPNLAKPPAHIDWDLWQGPAQERAFSERLVHYNWHWHWDYGNGDVGNQGIHETDLCLWGLDAGLPSRVSAMGGKFLWDDDKETPEVLNACFVYPDQKKMIEFEVRPWVTNVEQGATVGNIFYGSEGILVVKGYDQYEIFFGSNLEPGPKRAAAGELTLHVANFVKAVRARDKRLLNGPVETAHTASGLAHLANISYRLGRQLDFDPISESFPDDAEANGFLRRDYRSPYVVAQQT